MCLRNKHDLGLFNGMQGIVQDVYKEKKRHFIDFESDGMEYPRIRFDPKQFGEEKTITEYEKEGPLPFDYSYASTCHKSQGSQAKKILVIEQAWKDLDKIRWNYTSASRAQEQVYWAIP